MQLMFRLDDPVTSVIGAIEIKHKISNRRKQFVEALVACGKPSTANEIAAQVDPSIRESVRKRACECVRLGLVRDAGVRQCTVTGKFATVYWVV